MVYPKMNWHITRLIPTDDEKKGFSNVLEIADEKT